MRCRNFERPRWHHCCLSKQELLLEKRLFDPQQTLHVPHLLNVEVAQVIRRYVASGNIDGERGRAALADLADIPLRRYSHDLLLPQVWDLRNNLSAYDAVYVALAGALDTPMLTRDRLHPAIKHWSNWCE